MKLYTTREILEMEPEKGRYIVRITERMIPTFSATPASLSTWIEGRYDTRDKALAAAIQWIDRNEEVEIIELEPGEVYLESEQNR